MRKRNVERRCYTYTVKMFGNEKTEGIRFEQEMIYC